MDTLNKKKFTYLIGAIFFCGVFFLSLNIFTSQETLHAQTAESFGCVNQVCTKLTDNVSGTKCDPALKNADCQAKVCIDKTCRTVDINKTIKTCFSDDDCGTSGPVNLFYCANNDAFQSKTTYTCIKNNDEQGYCSSETEQEFKSTCSSTQPCFNGSCSTFKVRCNKDSDCGISGYKDAPYCSNGNVYQNYVTYKCQSPGTAQSFCSSTTVDNKKETCLTNQTCFDGFCKDHNASCVSDKECSSQNKKFTCINLECAEISGGGNYGAISCSGLGDDAPCFKYGCVNNVCQKISPGQSAVSCYGPGDATCSGVIGGNRGGGFNRPNRPERRVCIGKTCQYVELFSPYRNNQPCARNSDCGGEDQKYICDWNNRRCIKASEGYAGPNECNGLNDSISCSHKYICDWAHQECIRAVSNYPGASECRGVNDRESCKQKYACVGETCQEVSPIGPYKDNKPCKRGDNTPCKSKFICDYAREACLKAPSAYNGENECSGLNDKTSCKKKYICQNEKCVPGPDGMQRESECNGPNDQRSCKPKFICDYQNRKCFEAPARYDGDNECSGWDDWETCSPKYVCSGEKCEEAPKGYQGPEECEGLNDKNSCKKGSVCIGMNCVPRKGQNAEGSKECTNSSECTRDEYGCTSTEKCEAVPWDSETKTCSSEADCTVSYICVGETCIAKPASWTQASKSCNSPGSDPKCKYTNKCDKEGYCYKDPKTLGESNECNNVNSFDEKCKQTKNVCVDGQCKRTQIWGNGSSYIECDTPGPDPKCSYKNRCDEKQKCYVSKSMEGKDECSNIGSYDPQCKKNDNICMYGKCVVRPDDLKGEGGYTQCDSPGEDPKCKYKNKCDYSSGYCYESMYEVKGSGEDECKVPGQYDQKCKKNVCKGEQCVPVKEGQDTTGQRICDTPGNDPKCKYTAICDPYGSGECVQDKNYTGGKDECTNLNQPDPKCQPKNVCIEETCTTKPYNFNDSGYTICDLPGKKDPKCSQQMMCYDKNCDPMSDHGGTKGSKKCESGTDCVKEDYYCEGRICTWLEIAWNDKSKTKCSGSEDKKCDKTPYVCMGGVCSALPESEDPSGYISCKAPGPDVKCEYKRKCDDMGVCYQSSETDGSHMCEESELNKVVKKCQSKNVCFNEQCVTRPKDMEGAAAQSCDAPGKNEPCKWHNKCDKSDGTCWADPAYKGPDECTNRGKVDSSCPKKKSYCVGMICDPNATTGSYDCTSNSDCVVSPFCDGSQCGVVAKGTTNARPCPNGDSDCTATGYCVFKSCDLKAKSGSTPCSSDGACVTSGHFCQGSYCQWASEIPTDDVKNLTSCDTEGPDDPKCKKRSMCVGMVCTPDITNGTKDCKTDSQCKRQYYYCSGQTCVYKDIDWDDQSTDECDYATDEPCRAGSDDYFTDSILHAVRNFYKRLISIPWLSWLPK